MSKTSRKKLHRLTGRVRRMLAKTNGRMMWDVIPDSEDISYRLRREEANEYGDLDAVLARTVTVSILERHKETMQDAVAEEVAPWIRKFNPYAATR